MMVTTTALPMGADLYNDLEPDPRKSWRDYIPGLVVATLATMAAGFISDHYHAPLTLMALLIGLALNFLGADRRMGPGLGFASRTLLRWGIVLVGARVTIEQIVQLGWPTLLAVVVILVATILAGVLAARLAGFDSAFGVLAGGAVAICGASAALALATTLGEKRASQAQLALVLVGIAAASATAMFFYPLFARELGFNDNQAGFMLGASVHDVAQALGAGYSFSERAGQVAAIVKLTRVALLAPVLAIVAYLFPSQGGSKAKATLIPWFVVGFFLFAGVNSIGIIPAIAGKSAEMTATAFLACAVAATGIRAPMGSLLATGPRPLLVIVASSLVALVLAMAAAWLLLR